MKERPILMSAPMVRALLNGTKTQTRRVVKGIALEWLRPNGFTPEFTALPENGLCPYGQRGDRLWVRESFSPYLYREGCWYWADGNIAAYDCEKPKPSIHMWRWASRITLEVTAVRVERLQDISADDAWAEGIAYSPDVDPVHDYKLLWESINGPGSWDANPWVWVISFRRLDHS